MNTCQLSNNDQFLYSPKNWLHLKKTNHKTLYFFLQLFILPYIDLRYIVILFITTLVLSRSANLPSKVQRNLYTTTLIFLLILSISIYYTTKSSNFSNISNHIIKIQPFIFFTQFMKQEAYFIKPLIEIQVYLSLSICRIIMISLTYLFTIKILLLTTDYEEIILYFFCYENNLMFIQNSYIPFIVVLSSQFLKIIFTQLDILKASYLLRGIKFKKSMYPKTILLIYSYLVNNFLVSLYTNIKFITQTLHSRDMSCKNLYIINISNK